MPAVTRIIPNLIVLDVEACARFWENLGFERRVEEPREDGLGFVLLNGCGVDLSYQSVESLRDDCFALTGRLQPGGVHLYVEVNDLHWAARCVGDAWVIMPPRDTSYGMREIAVVDPGGNVLTLAQRLD